jgi:hypothetical protein
MLNVGLIGKLLKYCIGARLIFAIEIDAQRVFE